MVGPFSTREANAEVVFSTPYVEAGYYSADERLDVSRFTRCYYAVGDKLSFYYNAQEPLQRFSTTQLTATSNPPQTSVSTSFQNARGRMSYFCVAGLTSVGLEIVAGNAAHNTNIGKGLQCIVSLSTFLIEPASSGSKAVFECAYDPTTGVISASASGPGTLSGCSYVCGKQTFTTATTTLSAVTSFFGLKDVSARTQTFPKNMQCATGINSFTSTCSSLGKVPQPSYDPNTGVAKLIEAFSCPDGAPSSTSTTNLSSFYSYVCVARHTIYECDNGKDDDNDGLMDKDDPGCYSDPKNPATYEPLRGKENAATTECQDGIDNDGDTKIDMADPGCDAPTDNSESPDPTHTATPTNTFTPVPEDTPTPSPTPTEPPATSTSTPTPQGTSTPTAAPSATRTPIPSASASPTPPNEGGSNEVATPTPTPMKTRPAPDGTIGGDITVGGKPFPGALVYLPEFVDLAITDKSGAFSFMGINSPDSGVTLRVRSTQLTNGGMDIPAKPGQAVEIQSQQLRNYNPANCPEQDKLLALYTAARNIRIIYLLAVKDQKQLSAGLKDNTEHKATGRALARMTSKARLYFELSSQLPDRQLLCVNPPASCRAVDLRETIRRMKASTRHVRLESLLFNRQMRLKNLRSNAESTKRINRIRQSEARALSHISKLARSTFDCR
jgi:hypothetical protein